MEPKIIDAAFMANFAKERGINLIPEFSGYKVGDKVIVTNGYGHDLHGHTILAIDAEPTNYGGRFYVYTDAYWFSVRPDKIRLAN